MNWSFNLDSTFWRVWNALVFYSNLKEWVLTVCLCLSLTITHQSLFCSLSSQLHILYLTSVSLIYSLSPSCLARSFSPFLLLSHTHQWLWHTSPAPLLPLQLHFICCRSSRVALLNDTVQPMVGVWVLLIMPVSLWRERYRQIRPEDPGAVAPYHPTWWGASWTQSNYKIAPRSNSDGGLEVQYLGPYSLASASGSKIAFHFSFWVCVFCGLENQRLISWLTWFLKVDMHI